MGHYAGKPAIDWHEGLSVVPAGGAFGVAGGPAFVSKDFIFFCLPLWRRLPVYLMQMS